MSARALVVVILAIVSGASAVVGVNQLRRPVSQQDAPKVETASVVVAGEDIARGRMVVKDDLKLKDWPKDMVPEGAIAKIEDAVDRAAALPIMAGEPVLNAKLAARDAGRGLSALVPKGMRAYTVQTARVAASVAGFVLPGNKVDVLLNLRGNQNDDSGGGSTTTLLQAVEILAVDQRLDAPTENKVDPKGLSSVTLLVTPEQAALLDLGQNLGTLTFSLRNVEDASEAEARPATLADIRFHHEKPIEAVQPQPAEVVPVAAEEKVEPDVYQIMTLRGYQRGMVTITAKKM